MNKGNSYKVINTTDNRNEVIFEGTSWPSAYYFCQSYAREHVGETMNMLKIDAAGNETIDNNFISAEDVKGQIHLYTQDFYNRVNASRTAKAEKAAAKAEQAEQAKALRDQIKAIKAESAAQIEALEAKIAEIKANAQAQIEALKTVPNEAETESVEAAE